MKKLLLLFTLLSFLFPAGVLAQEESNMEFKEETLEGTVREIVEEGNYEYDGVEQNFQKLRIVITKGSLADRTIEIESGNLPTSNSQKYKVGDKLLISYTKDLNGNDIFFINDYVRRDGLTVLFIMFCLLTILVGRAWGAASILGMIASFLIIFKFILPQILSGKDPVFITIIGSIIIIPFTFSLSHGIKLKTLIAGVGTIITLIAIGIISNYVIEILHLTGFTAEEASYLQFDLNNLLSMKGILLAGFIISSLGILDDITISQASVVSELKDANKNYGFRKLFQKGMNVGRDHIASLVNTLVLVYTGASLPLLLLFVSKESPYSEIINYEFIAEEIVRTLVGSIGLILAVPITTLIAAYFYRNLDIEK